MAEPGMKFAETTLKLVDIGDMVGWRYSYKQLSAISVLLLKDIVM